jgi:nucleoside recognition membrane protein YjiH
MQMRYEYFKGENIMLLTIGIALLVMGAILYFVGWNFNKENLKSFSSLMCVAGAICVIWKMVQQL